MKFKIKKNKFLKNVTWVFFGNALHAVFQFLLNVLAARILSENDYGLINYSISIVALFSAVGTLGFSGVTSKKFAENEEEWGEYLFSAFLSRIVVELPFIVAVYIIGYLHFPDDVICLFCIKFIFFRKSIYNSVDMIDYCICV